MTFTGCAMLLRNGLCMMGNAHPTRWLPPTRSLHPT